MKQIRLEDLEVFAHVADAKSFSSAARMLGLSPVVASTAIKRLEEALNTRLIARTTRSLRLTNEGEQYLSHARMALQSMRNGETALASLKGTFSGPLKLSLPSDIGRHHLLGWIEKHLENQARVNVEISIGDSVADLHATPIDLAVRYGVPKDSSLVYIPISEQNTRILCAAPSYLATHEPLTSIEQLSSHNCLRFKVGDAIYSRWTFGGSAPTALVGGTRVTDDAELVRRWAVAGLGIAYKSRLDVAEDLRNGSLRHVLPHLAGEPAPLGMLAVHRNLLTPSVMGLVEMLRSRCKDHLRATKEWISVT